MRLLLGREGYYLAILGLSNPAIQVVFERLKTCPGQPTWYYILAISSWPDEQFCNPGDFRTIEPSRVGILYDMFHVRIYFALLWSC
jgi:hypothetical protein